MQNASDRTVSGVIYALGGNAAVARVIGKEPSTVSEMKRSGSIKVAYWPAIISAARARGFDWITSDALMRMHSRREQAESPVSESPLSPARAAS